MLESLLLLMILWVLIFICVVPLGDFVNNLDCVWSVYDFWAIDVWVSLRPPKSQMAYFPREKKINDEIKQKYKKNLEGGGADDRQRQEQNDDDRHKLWITLHCGKDGSRDRQSCTAEGEQGSRSGNGVVATTTGTSWPLVEFRDWGFVARVGR